MIHSKKPVYSSSKVKISHIIAMRLFIAVFSAFVFSSLVIYVMLYFYCKNRAYELLKNDSTVLVIDTYEGIKRSMADTEALPFAWKYWDEGEEAAQEAFEGKNYTYIVKRDGTIILSGNEEFLGKNIRDISLISGIIDQCFKDYSDTISFQATPVTVKTLDGKKDVYYMVVVNPEYPDAILTMAFVKESFEDYAPYSASFAISNRDIGQTGYSIIIDPDNIMIADKYEQNRKSFPYTQLIERYEKGEDPGIEINEGSLKLSESDMIALNLKMLSGKDKFWDTESYYCLTKYYGIYLLSMYPVNEALSQANDTILAVVLIEVVIFIVLFIVLQLLISRRIVDNLDTVNMSLARITAGDLNEHVEVRDSREFDMLSTDINTTVDRLKEYIENAAARIDEDLAVARAIQKSMMPNIFPSFSDRKEFELYASMHAAKEVGGDFYDFYMLEDNILGFLVADVSGKSIPGAMFMMRSKAIIRNLAESGLKPAEVFTQANSSLCEGNKTKMFVTAWMGYLDLKTGTVRFVNAGHNPPALIGSNGTVAFLKMKANLVLAGMDGIQYREQEIQLEKGDILYLYTDGVTEAMNINGKMYGNNRLLKLLSSVEDNPGSSAENGIVESICHLVIKNVTGFAEGAEQSDDITMLCIRYLGTVTE